jgi:hypothetical protein
MPNHILKYTKQGVLDVNITLTWVLDGTRPMLVYVTLPVTAGRVIKHILGILKAHIYM